MTMNITRNNQTVEVVTSEKHRRRRWTAHETSASSPFRSFVMHPCITSAAESRDNRFCLGRPARREASQLAHNGFTPCMQFFELANALQKIPRLPRTTRLAPGVASLARSG
jgi:hypothetical protein